MTSSRGLHRDRQRPLAAFNRADPGILVAAARSFEDAGVSQAHPMQSFGACDSPLVLPIMIGPGIRRMSPLLMWTGGITAVAGYWCSPEPVHRFRCVADRCYATGHPLETLFRNSEHYASLGFRQGAEESRLLAPLRPRVQTVIVVGAGTREAYGAMEKLHARCLPLAASLLRETQVATSGASAFVWRVSELMLELNEDPDSVLSWLQGRALALQHPEMLMAECVLFSYVSALRMSINCASPFPESLHILSRAAESMGVSPSDATVSEVLSEEVAFSVFSEIVGRHFVLGDARAVDRIRRVLEECGEPLTAARTKCKRRARQIVESRPSDAGLHVAVDELVDELAAEATHVLESDEIALKKLRQNLADSPTFWGSMATLLGYTAGALPPLVGAAAAVTAFSVLGTSALQASRERSEALARSPWRFLYSLQ